MPLMVDSEGNVLTDVPDTPHHSHHRPSSYQASPLSKPKQPQKLYTDDDDDGEEEEDGLELVMQDFAYEALDPDEVTRQPSAKRTRPVVQTAVRSQPKTGLNNSRLLSFAMDDDDDDDDEEEEE
jgi:hypothetical protein